MRETRASVSPQTRVYSRSEGKRPPSCRSFCRRSAMTASAPSSARSTSGSYVTAGGSAPHRDAAVQHVADDDDPLAREIAQGGTQRVRVEEALGGVRVPSVAGVDDGRVG